MLDDATTTGPSEKTPTLNHTAAIGGTAVDSVAGSATAVDVMGLHPTALQCEIVLEIPIVLLGSDVAVPTYAKPGDAGVDLRAAAEVLLPAGGGRGVVPTGLRIAIPEGHAGFVQPRSGLARDHGVTCLNTPGLIDAGYRGELAVLLVNTDPTEDFLVRVGERIAQLVIQRVEHVRFVPVDELDESERGHGGWGHTGR